MPKTVTLICENCLSRNYTTTRNKYATERLAIKKFCKFCNCSTLHKETK